eukprot:817853-Alexandrium_andersonii.AAC.1
MLLSCCRRPRRLRRPRSPRRPRSRRISPPAAAGRRSRSRRPGPPVEQHRCNNAETAEECSKLVPA